MLLDQVMLSIKNGARISYRSLASELGMEIGIVQSAVEQLGRLGYLERMVPGHEACTCTGRCSQCRCSRVGPELWRLSDKGLRYLEKEDGVEFAR
ncbi:MAG: hypothetical protein KBA26_04335 [Candidatus Delongbacteria bacterium]|nr:hypothetical protein [Candidatus Delongbacteria bacterium]